LYLALRLVPGFAAKRKFLTETNATIAGLRLKMSGTGNPAATVGVTLGGTTG